MAVRIFEDNNPNFGKAFQRIGGALRSYSPDDVTWVDNKELADLFVVHVVGGEEFGKLLRGEYDLSRTIIVQHCLYTTDITVDKWQPIWKESRAVVSWNNLYNVIPDGTKFVRIPWGADENLFSVTPSYNKNIKVFATGHVAKSECIDDIYEACKATGNIMNHTGENFKWDSRFYKFHSYMNDGMYSSLLGRSQYVAGLRIIEGFEMACIEGAMTGSVPIVPNLPSYDFYKDFGIMIDMKLPVADQLISIFNDEYKSLSKDQIDYVRNEFSWKNVCSRFYKELEI